MAHLNEVNCTHCPGKTGPYLKFNFILRQLCLRPQLSTPAPGQRSMHALPVLLRLSAADRQTNSSYSNNYSYSFSQSHRVAAAAAAEPQPQSELRLLSSISISIGISISICSPSNRQRDAALGLHSSVMVIPRCPLYRYIYNIIHNICTAIMSVLAVVVN